MNAKLRLGLLVGAVAASCAWGADQTGVEDQPDMKEGLWETTAMTLGSIDEPMHMTMCTSNAVNRKMYEDTHDNTDGPCKTIHFDRVGAVITEEKECNRSGTITRSKSVTTLTGNTGMRIELRDVNNKVESIVEMNWMGACPAGMKLGDMAGPDGKVMVNVMTP